LGFVTWLCDCSTRQENERADGVEGHANATNISRTHSFTLLSVAPPPGMDIAADQVSGRQAPINVCYGRQRTVAAHSRTRSIECDSVVENWSNDWPSIVNDAGNGRRVQRR